MKRKDIGIALAALCLSAALCAVPAGVFAVTDSALFSGAFTQNTRRGSLDVTGDDVYLARVLREPGEEIYIESNANPDLYSQNVNAKFEELMQAGLIDQNMQILMQELVARAWDAGTLRCIIETSDITGYSGSDEWGGFELQVENMTGKTVYLSVWSNDGMMAGIMEQISILSARAMLGAYLKYLGFDVFNDWKYYSTAPEDEWDDAGWVDVWAVSETGEVCIEFLRGWSFCRISASGGTVLPDGLLPLE